MRGRKDQSDLIYSQRSYAVVPIKSSGLMLPPPSPSPTPGPCSAQLPGSGRGEGVTHTGAADEDHTKGLHDACNAHHPSESQEEDDTKDVLQARQVHTHEGAHTWGLPGKPVSVSVAPNHYQPHKPTPPPLFLHPPLSYSLHLHPFIPLPPDSSSHFPAFMSASPLLQTNPTLLLSIAIPHLPSLCPQILSLRLNLFSFPNLFSLPSALPPSLFFPRPSPAPASFFHPHCFLLLHVPYFLGVGWCSWPGH